MHLTVHHRLRNISPVTCSALVLFLALAGSTPVAVFVSLAALVPKAWAGDEIKCNGGGNQFELNICASDDFAKADKELNKTYQSLIKKEVDDRLFISKLRIAQKAWLVYRDADLEARFACAEDDIRLCWGSMYPMSYSLWKAELTRERTKHLQQILEDRRGR